MKPMPLGICVALAVTLAWQPADAQRQFPKRTTPGSNYAYSTDIVDAVDIFGMRTGMTLTEAASAATAWGVDLSLPDETVMHGGFIDGPSPELFTLIATPNDKFRGLNTFRNTGGRTAAVRVFPRDPASDIRDPNNLIVYWIQSFVEPPLKHTPLAVPQQQPVKLSSGAVMKRSGTVSIAAPTQGTIADIQRDAFFAQARQRFGEILDPETDGANVNQAYCSNAANIARVAAARGASYRAGKPDPLGAADNPVVLAWRPCGDVISLGAATHSDGRVRNATVIRFDTALSEAAYQSFRQFIGYTN